MTFTLQEVSTSVPKLTTESSGQYSDFNVLSSLNSQVGCAAFALYGCQNKNVHSSANL